MFHFYILFSEIKNRYYIGHTGNSMDERLRKHNADHKGFTGKTGDWKVMYTEIYTTKEEAYKRERELKKWKSRIKIEALIKNNS